jgi:hypothetical protein
MMAAVTLLLMLAIGSIGIGSGLWSQFLTVNVTIAHQEDGECARSLGFWKHAFNGNAPLNMTKQNCLVSLR